MWFIQPKEDYVSRMPWKHADESAVMSWQIRARDYNTFVANCGFLVWVIGCAIFVYFLITKAAGAKITDVIGLGAIGIYILIIPVAMSIFFQTTIIVYRFTEKGAEICAWKPQIDSVKPVMKWTAIVSGVAVLFLIFVDPAFLIAAIGPVGVGVMAAMMGSSKGYQKLMRGEQHYEIEWPKTDTIRVWRKRNLIALTYQWRPYSKNSRYRPRTERLYCHPDELGERIAFFRKHLPSAAYEEGKIDI
ncbi:hypothetical protein [Litchfieldella rifensis]|uniref:Uncharacterized protein n=1 Tax=Litchfieldella rifensis TaxID=762643 RepID=A0ABV7LTN0_9GAMM